MFGTRESGAGLTHALPVSEDHKKTIQLAVEEILFQEETGASLDDQSVGLKYPSLLPDILVELRLMRGIRSAQKAAKSGAPAPSSDGDAAAEVIPEFVPIEELAQDYQFVETLDHGGQGVVYKAVERGTNRQVAIKVLRDGPLSNQRERDRFSREIGIIAQVRHPNIVGLLRSGATAHHQFFVMEYIDGLAIDDYVSVNGSSVQEVVRLVESICRAVACAHQHGVVHRDLKPSNVLVDLDGCPHILDFGLAKDIHDTTPISDGRRLSLTGQLLGTLPYASPEQVMGRPGQVDIRSDVYSLGVILYQLLAGELPCPVEGAIHQVRSNILNRPPRSIRQAIAVSSERQRGAVGMISDDLERVVMRALAKEKQRRFASAGELADDLSRYLAGDTVSARADSSWYLLRKLIARHRLGVGLSLAFLLLIAVGLVGMTILWRRADHVARVAQAGLQMGSYVKLGSVARDSGRVGQAVGMFEKAAQIGRTISTDDASFNSRNFSVNYQLAELHYDRGHPAEARPYCDAAIHIAEGLYKSDANNLEWQRLYSFSFVLQAKKSLAARAYDRALQALDRAVALRQELAVKDPANDDLQSELAQAIALQGQCLRQMGRLDPALNRYQSAYQIYQMLATSKPDHLDRALDVAIAENRFASWHLSVRTPAGNEAAAKWLAKAEKTLAHVSEMPGAGECSADIGRLRDAISGNMKLIKKRAAATPNPSGH